MPRVSEPLDDTTSLDGPRIDVNARIGWLMRVSRSAAGLSLRQMSAAMAEHGSGMSAATLSRIESEGLRSVTALEGYAQVLGLPAASLRVAVDLMCRSFSYAPSAPPPRVQPSLDDFSAACTAVAGGSPSATDWLDFSRHHADDTPFGLPRDAMTPLLRRLSLELCRSVGQARYLRWEALLQLRCTAYGDVVAEVVEAVLREPGMQCGDDLISAVVERQTRAIVEWVSELLCDPSIHLVRGATFAIQSMLVTGGIDLDEWSGLPPAFDKAWGAAEGDPDRLQALDQVRTALPPQLQQRLADQGRPAKSAQRPRVWTRGRQNLHYGFAVSIAHQVTSARNLPDDPMLARLLFEAMFELRGVRMTNASILLATSPFAADLVPIVLVAREHAPDVDHRPDVSRLAAFFHCSGELPDVGSLLTSGDLLDLRHALTIYGRGGHHVPQEVLVQGLGADALTVRCALTALGLAGDPRLTEIAADATRPRSVREAAGWWLRHGPRIVD